MVRGTKDLTIGFNGTEVEFIPNRALPFMYHNAAAQAGEYSHMLGLNKTTTDQFLIDGLFPGLAVRTPGRGCGGGLNAYYLHEFDADSNGRLLKFAADFSYNCGGGDHQVQGVIRYNSSIPSVLQQVFAVAGSDMVVPEGRAIILDGSRSWSPASKIAKANWTQESGPLLDLTQCKKLLCQTYSPLMPSGGGVAKLRINVETESGLVGSDTVQITVQSNIDRKTSFEMWGRGFVANSATATGGDFSIGAVNGKFSIPNLLSIGSVYKNQTSERLNIKFTGLTPTGSILKTDVALMNKRGSPLVVGTFNDPGTGGGYEAFDDIASVVISNVAQGSACGHQVGQMIIGDIDRDPTDFSNIRSLSAFIRTNCQVLGMTELESNFARILINHLPSNAPVAKITGSNTVKAGNWISLSSANSSSIRTIVTKVWRRIYGPNDAEFSTYNAGNDAAMQVASTVPVGTKYVFALDVIDAAGEQGTDLILITVN